MALLSLGDRIGLVMFYLTGFSGMNFLKLLINGFSILNTIQNHV